MCCSFYFLGRLELTLSLDGDDAEDDARGTDDYHKSSERAGVAYTASAKEVTVVYVTDSSMDASRGTVLSASVVPDQLPWFGARPTEFGGTPVVVTSDRRLWPPVL